MSNKRKIIRDGFVDFLKNKTPALDRVFSGRVRSLEKAELPAINVRDADEKADLFNKAPRQYLNSLDIAIEISCQSKDNIHDQVAIMMEAVQSAIDHEDRFTPLDEVVREIYYEGSSVDIEPGDKVQVSGLGTLRYRVEYFTNAGAYATTADEYLEVFASINDGAAETEVIIDQ